MTSVIGVIGPGGIGAEVAKLAVNAGLKVVLSNSRGPDSLKDQVAELGANARAATFEDAAKASDIVVLAVPLKAYSALPSEPLDGKVVIDMMNYYPHREAQIAALDEKKLTSSELVQQHFRGARVVKALHNQDAPHLLINAKPNDRDGRSTLPLAGDDAEAKRIVTEFLDRVGYDAVDAGSLADSWRIEPGSPIYVVPYAPTLPEGLSEEDAEAFYVTTPGEPISADRARELIAAARRPERVGGFPEDLPAIWTRMVGRYAEVVKKARNDGQ